MKIRFWGTRGSIPTPLGSDAVRAKVRNALKASRGRDLNTEDSIDAFLDELACQGQTKPYSLVAS